MAGDWANRLAAGQLWEPSAEWVNNVTHAARQNMTNRAHGGAASPFTPPDGLVWVVNNSGEDCDVTDVLGVDSILFTHDDNPNEFLYRWTINGVTPSFPEHLGNFVIAMEPIASGEMGRAYISCVCPAYVDMKAAGDKYADITDSDATQLTSGDIGAAQIVASSGTGAQYCLVRLGTVQLDGFTVKLQSVSGSGAPLDPWLYKATSFSDGFTYSMSIGPEAPRWGNYPTAATVGLGRYDNGGIFRLSLAYEGRTPGLCS